MAERPRMSFEFDQVDDAILVFLHREFLSDGSLRLDASEVHSRLVETVPVNVVRLCLELLEERELTESRLVPASDPLNISSVMPGMQRQRRIFNITRSGLDYVQNLPDDRYDTISSRFVPVHGVVVEDGVEDIPASDRGVARSDNSWNEPDHDNEIDEQTERRIRELIKEAINEAQKASFDNLERSQVLAFLEAADIFANAPVPQWRKVKDALEPLANVAQIAGAIAAILTLLVML